MAQFLFQPSPATEAVDFLKSKAVVSREVFDELLPELRARAFAIAGIEDAGVLQRVRDRIADLPAGADWNAVKRDVVEEISPWLDAGDGGTLASQRRAELLMRHHGFQAYRSAQYETIQRTKHVFPYLQYIATQDERTRASHRALHGVVLPADDPFWQTHTPPWGWGCRCQVVQISERQKQAIEAEDADKPADHRRVLTAEQRERMNASGTLYRAMPPSREDGGRWGLPQTVDLRAEGGPTGAADLRPPLEKIRAGYDADIWQGFERKMQSINIGSDESGAPVSVWAWLGGARLARQVPEAAAATGSASLAEIYTRLGIDETTKLTPTTSAHLIEGLRKENPVTAGEQLQRLRVPRAARYTRADVTAALDEFLAFVPPARVRRLPKLSVSAVKLADARGDYLPHTGRIRLSQSLDAAQMRRTLWHELTHWLHLERPGDDAWVVMLADHFRARTAGETMARLAPYRSRGLRDEWYDPYAGTIYGTADEATHLGVEVPTRHLETLADPVDFARLWNDPVSRETLLIALEGLFE